MTDCSLAGNRKAFLDMLASSEGTSKLGDNGYNVIVGGNLFDSYADHPRVMVDLPKLGIKSSAAGRYQLLARFYDFYKAKLRLLDFSPASQDAIAMQQIKERLALDAIDAGALNEAILKCSNIWASLPGSEYGQRETSFGSLRDAYVAAGGIVAPTA